MSWISSAATSALVPARVGTFLRVHLPSNQPESAKATSPEAFEHPLAHARGHGKVAGFRKGSSRSAGRALKAQF
jgi:hypothetical protein